ncbi:conjugal transfer protein TraF [Veronia pacifica]|uniref:Conjugal transfer protein TraF n=1 Tax=Veronia pacifica TaxID=1080227 RepID=A0A1C3ECA9_9GAMM|nr:conjugal transfer protein TraF [Veronia pacifica]ODA30882.1 hypothetical protein A8L45_18900 [Veronia pacifica]
MYKKRITSAVMLMTLSSSAAALSGTDARSIAMGGTGVASSSYLTAPFYNPAQLTKFYQSDNFGALLPSVSIGISDKDDLYGRISDFQDADSASRADPLNINKGLARISALENIGTRDVNVDAELGFAVTFPNQFLSLNLFSHTQAVSRVEASVSAQDLNPVNIGQPMTSYVHGASAATFEIGLAMAKAFSLPYRGNVLSLGISPKVQKLAVHNVKETVDSFDNDKYRVPGNYVTASVFNADVGMSYKPSQEVTVGLSARNVIAQELKSEVSSGSQITYLIEPSYTLGVAYDNRWLLLAADLELNETRHFEEFAANNRYLKLGAEIDAWNWAQFRVGYSVSTKEKEPNLASAGIGFTPFGKMGVDIGVQYRGERDLAASAQFVMTF